MNIAKAYPSDAHIEKYTRNVILSDSGLEITDSWSFDDKISHPVILNFITYEKPAFSEDAPNILRIGELGSLSLSLDYQASNIRIEELPITDPRLMQCWKHSLYRIRIAAPENADSIQIMLS